MHLRTKIEQFKVKLRKQKRKNILSKRRKRLLEDYKVQ